MRKGEGKIEIIACRDEVLALLRQGHTVAKIYASLHASGKITAKRSQFYNLVAKHVLPLLAETVAPGARSYRAPPRVPRRTDTSSNPTSSTNAGQGKPTLGGLEWDPSRKMKWE